MDTDAKIILKDHIISMYDLDNFIHIAKKLKVSELFHFLNNLQIITIETILEYKPEIIKNIGDSNLIIFSTDNLDEKVMALYRLKEKIENYIKSNGFNHRVSFFSHYGEVAVGYIGKEPFLTKDAFGDVK